jgi:UTP--glucose-1-phosphate uridylyltransferase
MGTMKKVRKAVLPAAGLGTRLLPVTKALPKEMLPLVDKPVIQYAVEEAVASGITEIILVTRPGKDNIERYFANDADLLRQLEKLGEREQARIVSRWGRRVKFRRAYQRVPRGLGHAVGCARHLVADEPFVVLLPDDVVDCVLPCTKQLLGVYEEHRGCIVAAQEVHGEAIGRGGIMAVKPVKNTRWEGRLFRVTDMVEKPKHNETPSACGIIGRYVLEPDIFSFIDAVKPGHGGESQLTDALRLYARKHAVYAFRFEGCHMDAGHKLGFLCANVHYALKHQEVGPTFRDFLKSLEL